MAPIAEATRNRRGSREDRLPRRDRLVSFGGASRTLGVSRDTLRNWYEAGAVPAIVGAGGGWSTYQSWVDMVMASARPGAAGDVRAVTRTWFAIHIPEALSA
jgi:hypothetical protein